MKLGRWTSGILLGRWMSVIFFGPKMESHEDMWNPLCFHGTGLHLPTRRRRWQSVKGIQVWNPKKHSHSCSSWQLPMVAVHAGPRHLLGIMVLWCYSLFSETCYFVVLALFCGSGTPFSWKLGRENGSHQWTWCRCWLWFGDGVYAFTEAGVKKPYRIAEMWGQCIQRSNPFKSLVIPAMLQFCWVSVVISCIGDIGVEWGCRIVIYGAFACGYVLPIVSWGRITIQFVPFVAVFPCFSIDPSFTFLCLDAMIQRDLFASLKSCFAKMWVIISAFPFADPVFSVLSSNQPFILYIYYIWWTQQ